MNTLYWETNDNTHVTLNTAAHFSLLYDQDTHLRPVLRVGIIIEQGVHTFTVLLLFVENKTHVHHNDLFTSTMYCWQTSPSHDNC
jgi:hypothetical protein